MRLVSREGDSDGCEEEKVDVEGEEAGREGRGRSERRRKKRRRMSRSKSRRRRKKSACNRSRQELPGGIEARSQGYSPSRCILEATQA